MNERIELLENGNTLITAPIEFHYEDGRKRIFFAGRPDDPPIVEAIMAGKAPRTLSLTKLDTNLPFSWQEQLKLFGMA